MNRGIKRRLERLEETPEDNLLAMRLDRPVIGGTAEHAAAIAAGRDAPVLYLDEPWPANPIL